MTEDFLVDNSKMAPYSGRNGGLGADFHTHPAESVSWQIDLDKVTQLNQLLPHLNGTQH